MITVSRILINVIDFLIVDVFYYFLFQYLVTKNLKETIKVFYFCITIMTSSTIKIAWIILNHTESLLLPMTYFNIHEIVYGNSSFKNGERSDSLLFVHSSIRYQNQTKLFLVKKFSTWHLIISNFDLQLSSDIAILKRPKMCHKSPRFIAQFYDI